MFDSMSLCSILKLFFKFYYSNLCLVDALSLQKDAVHLSGPAIFAFAKLDETSQQSARYFSPAVVVLNEKCRRHSTTLSMSEQIFYHGSL